MKLNMGIINGHSRTQVLEISNKKLKSAKTQMNRS